MAKLEDWNFSLVGSGHWRILTSLKCWGLVHVIFKFSLEYPETRVSSRIRPTKGVEAPARLAAPFRCRGVGTGDRLRSES
jgi:hypothetical protein